MIVVDTNVLAYLYLPGEHTAAAEALYERDPDWSAPILWRSEFRNILAGYMPTAIKLGPDRSKAMLFPPLWESSRALVEEFFRGGLRSLRCKVRFCRNASVSCASNKPLQ